MIPYPKLTSAALALALASFVQAPPAAASEPAAETPAKPQMLIVSFDGAGDNGLWRRSRKLGTAHNAHFTYFLSCTNVIARPNAARYQAPRHKAGRSNVGFAVSVEDVRDRLGEIWAAHEEGHEIASHGCGHFDGASWSRADWLQELKSFDTALRDAWKNAGIGEREPAGWADFVAHGISGFRAPYLSHGAALPEAVKARGFRYDASLITRGPQGPETEHGLLRFGLPLIPEGPKARPIIAMDYNMFARHSGAVEDAAGTADYEARSYSAFRAAFDRQYQGDRIPLQIGFHFVEMNGGAYWRALERIVSEVCTMKDVACVSYAEAVDRLAPAPDRAAGPIN